ncbi:MAG TPA: YdcF family protein [Thermosynechococcaceae cyanobacterium]
MQLRLLRPKTRPTRHYRVRSLLCLLLLLPIGWVGYREVRSYFERPQALLVLGGATERENFAAEFARQHPHLPIWISGGSNPEYTQSVFADAGIDPKRIHIDRAAVDTVTNFTTLVDQLRAQGIDSVYLITSDYHMRRAQVIGEIVFGSRDIYLKPVAVPSDQEAESVLKVLRDGARAVLWVTTGHTGASANQVNINQVDINQR